MGGPYFTTPILIFWVWWANRRHDVPATSADPLLPVRVIAVLSALSVLTAIFLFPGRAVAVWPWTLTR